MALAKNVWKRDACSKEKIFLMFLKNIFKKGNLSYCVLVVCFQWANYFRRKMSDI